MTLVRREAEEQLIQMLDILVDLLMKINLDAQEDEDYGMDS